jgi:prepilin-type N-terminal cleavage/methylation domain-containing protein
MQREHRSARAAGSSENGFTLIELMMVVLIISILIAVLIPTFVGARDRANDRAMQTSLRNGLTATKAVYVDGQSYLAATPTRLNAEGVPVKFVDASIAPAQQNEISVDRVTDEYVVLGGQSRTGTCFFVSDDVSSLGTRFARVPSASSCAASNAPAQNAAAWQPRW